MSSVNSNGSDELNFDESLQPTEVKFRWKGKRYVLREASHALARHYRSVSIATFQPTPDGGMVPGPKFPETEAVLVAGCVFEVGEDGVSVADKPVGEAVVKGWPNRVVRPLFEQAREISMLTERDLSSPEALDKEIQRLQSIRERVVKDQVDGGQAGNLQSAGTVSSA